MSIYAHSNVAVTGGSSTYVARNLNHLEVHELRNGPAAFEKICKHIAPNALHNSGEVSNQPKCHSGTRVAILDYLFAWAAALVYTHPIIWLHGPAGAGKSAILRTIAQRLFERRLLLASFFFFRTRERRNTSEYVIATIAYQLALSIPETRQHIEKAIQHNPMIFSLSLSLWDQAMSLVVSPIVSVFYDPSFIPHRFSRIIIIDGLDECSDSSKQCEILQVFRRIIQSVSIPLAILVASCPEHHIRAEFNHGDLNECSSRLALDDSYDPDSDIKKYLVDRFDFIHRHHPMKSFLPSLWLAQGIVDKLVAKASGQFIYVATVDKFISSPRHNPAKRLDIILGTLNAEGLRPFEQLDNLYSVIFGTIVEEDLASTLRIMGVMLVPRSDYGPDDSKSNIRHAIHRTRSPSFVERLLGLDSGDVQRLLFDLESLLTVCKSDEDIQFFHGSLSDYLFDRSRSGKFWIDTGLVYVDLAAHCVRQLHDWLEIRTLLMLNGSLFFSKATPTPELRQAIQDCDFDQMIIPSSKSDPHWFSDLCPTLLQLVVQKSRFSEAKKMFAIQLDNFRQIVAERIHEVYTSNLSLRCLIVSLAHLSDRMVCALTMVIYPRLSSAERHLESTRGFSLANIQKLPPIMPCIRTLLNHSINSRCVLNDDQYAEVALFILDLLDHPECYTDPPSSNSMLMADLVPPLLLKSSIHVGLVRYAEKFTGPWWYNLSDSFLEALKEYLRRQSRLETRDIIDLTTPPSETQSTSRKRSQQESDILDLSKETSPRPKPSASRVFKRVRTRGPRSTGTRPVLSPLADSGSVTECVINGNGKSFHFPSYSHITEHYNQNQTGGDANHAITISDSK